MTVVDAGVLAALTMDAPNTPAARALFLEDPDWAAPPLWRSDFRRILFNKVRLKLMTEGQARAAYEMACEIVGENEREPDTTMVIETARSLGIDLYDAEYLAVARELGIRYVTSDDDVAQAIPHHATRLQMQP